VYNRREGRRMSRSSPNAASWFSALRARLHFIRATFHRHWGNLGSGRVAYERAVELFTRAIDLDPLYIDAYYQRGVLYWREIQNYHHAIRDLTRVMELEPERTPVLFIRAMAYQQRGDFDQAISDLEQFLAASPRSTWYASAELQLSGLRDLRAARIAARKPPGRAAD